MWHMQNVAEYMVCRLSPPALPPRKHIHVIHPAAHGYNWALTTPAAASFKISSTFLKQLLR